jgi:hypothetical protein
MGINQMDKHVNYLSREKVFSREVSEHGLKSTPTTKQLSQIEKKEHRLKRSPTYAQMMKIEAKEHKSGKGGC